jgi:polysaccharide export outer membrane protein
VPAADLHGYALYPGDLIAIDVFDQPDLSVAVRIPPSGSIRFPLLGEITPVVGREVNDLGDDLRRRLEADYLQQATVTITVREFAKRHAYVMGSIARPDALALDPFVHITALGAIGAAGGFLDEANRDAVLVMRDGPVGRISFLVSVGSPGHAPRDVELLPNDIVVVPHLDQVYVMGQVAHPGAISLRNAHNTVLRAIGDAGGFLDEANRDAVVVVRENAAGAASSTIPLGSVGSGLKEIVLQANDTVLVPRLDRVYVIGQVNHPGAVALPSQEPLTVSKAISLAGGFDRYAREGNVQLLRAGVPVQTIDVAAILTGDKSKDDPRLAPGDTVFVPQRRY